MNGRQVLLVLSHLFRARGPRVSIEDAVYYLSFRWRYGRPSSVRRMLTLAVENQMISRNGNEITAEFLFDKQVISPEMSSSLRDSIDVKSDYSPML
ncbi:MAG: DUF2240 family protein [Candidatus Thorarchaeota archaeon]|nr:DUF2240 family protein [Candidatus Thorarchaeota archaeon]